MHLNTIEANDFTMLEVLSDYPNPEKEILNSRYAGRCRFAG
ncbi:MAG TPA: hypothetical protein PK776_13730 [Flavobacterium sp.]|nr:hypothetical protein [Flavobacterium sp.]